VPDYTSRSLSMSGLLVTDEAARRSSRRIDDQLPQERCRGRAAAARSGRAIG
jgi:hypothetical protein